MKLVRYGAVNQERPGLVDPQGRIRDLSEHVSDVGGLSLLPESLRALSTVDWRLLPEVSDNPRLGPPIAGVAKIIGVGLNYKDHAAEAGMPIPFEPPLFMKPTSAIIGPNDDVEIPPGSEKTDWEVELGVVVGKPGKYIKEAQAAAHIAGYLVCNDISERAWQLERGGQWDKGKGHDTFAPLGPWLVTADEISDPQNLDLWLEVDGHRYQSGNTRTMIFTVGYLVSYISQFFSLRSGDIISTGTPPGVGLGQRPPKYLNIGQVMRLGIAGLGVQQQRTRGPISASSG
jgi:2-keto-4-pentenoate hydratase/2-oxohepta-3-ene-1,7-dioic acid hydratase in catechol pathway